MGGSEKEDKEQKNARSASLMDLFTYFFDRIGLQLAPDVFFKKGQTFFNGQNVFQMTHI